MRRGGSVLPRATPSSRPIPSCAIRSSSSTSTATPASLGNRRRATGELARRQRIARFVRELARQVAAVAEKLAALDSRAHARRDLLTAGDDDGPRRRRRRLVLAGLVAAAVELRQRQPFGNRLRHLRRVVDREPPASTNPTRGIRRCLAQSAGGGGDLPHRIAAERGALPCPDEQHAPGSPRRHRSTAGGKDVVRRARENSFAARARAISPPDAASTPGDRLGPLVLAPGHDEQIDLDVRERRAGDRSSAASSSLRRRVSVERHPCIIADTRLSRPSAERRIRHRQFQPGFAHDTAAKSLPDRRVGSRPRPVRIAGRRRSAEGQQGRERPQGQGRQDARSSR